MQASANDRPFVDLQGCQIKNRTKSDILFACIELFAQAGFSAVSVREITRRVGIKESSLYNHFRSKDEIIETVYANYRMELSRLLPSPEAADAMLDGMEPEMFFQQGLDLFKISYDNPVMEKLWRIVQIEQFRDARARNIYIEDIRDRIFDFLARVFGRLMQAGKIETSDPTELAAAYQYPIFAMMLEYSILRCDNRDTSALEARMDAHVRAFIRRIRLD